MLGLSFADEPVRRRMEAQLNASLNGYSVRLPELRLHLLGFAVELRGLTVRQNAHPEPAVLVIPDLTASVNWRALLSARLVGDFLLAEPRLHVDLKQLSHEANDKVKLEDRGWQRALEDIYPLKINQLRIRDGELTYIDDDPQHPLQVTRLNATATNIRNIRSPEKNYPSPFHVDAIVFEKGRLRVDGDANFLAEPNPGLRADVKLDDVPLSSIKSVAMHANLQINGGTLSAHGELESGPGVQRVHLREATIDGVAIDYVHRADTEKAEAKRAAEVSKVTDEPTAKNPGSLAVDHFRLHNAALGYVDQTTTPAYRVFLAAADVEVSNFSNSSNAGPAGVAVRGRFMGSGPSRLDASLQARQDHPDLNLAIQIEPTALTSMNDLFRAYGNFDVKGGEFAFYSELNVHDGAISGYVKPLFTNVKVYDPKQDADKPILHQIYQGLVGGVASLLENRRDAAVATQADLSGRADSPDVSTWQVVLNLVRNGFFKAILPGFDRAARGGSS